MRWGRAFLTVAALAASFSSTPVVGNTRQPAVRESVRLSEPAARTLPRRPLHFEENIGQVDERVTHLVRARGYIAYFTPGETVFALRSGGPDVEAAFPDDTPYDIDVVRMRFVGASPARAVDGCEPLVGRSHYFIGDDPDRWVRDVPHFGSLEAREIYPGIGVRWRSGDENRLTYDLLVAPGADPDEIAMHFDGAEGLALDPDGALVMTTPNGELRHSAPVAFQEGGEGRCFVRSGFALRADGSVGFRVGPYDSSQPLVIDPGIEYSTYVGGSGDDRCYDVDVLPNGDVVTCGGTFSTNFPTSGAYQSTNVGGVDACILKLSASGGSLLYATYVGGSSSDYANGIEVDGSGQIHAAGHSYSTNFPTVSPLQSTGDTNGDGVVFKLSSNGRSLSYSTYLGGTDVDWMFDVAVDTDGSIFVNGWTQSTDFPTASPIQRSHGGGTWDGFVAKIAATGASLTYSTYLGGSGDDTGWGRMTVRSGAVYVPGWTTSSNYPVSTGAAQGTHAGGGTDAVLTKVNSSGSAWAYSTYIGGSDEDHGIRVAVDSGGAAYLVGFTASSDFPTTSSAYSSENQGGRDAFVTKVNASGTGWTYSTLVGGSNDEWPNTSNSAAAGIDVDADGNAYVAGYTNSGNFPKVAAFQESYGGGTYDTFVFRLSDDGEELEYASLLGGGDREHPYDVHVNADGSAWIVGTTWSGDFPTASPLYSSNSGSNDVYLTKIAAPTAPAAPLNPSTAATDETTVIVSWLDVADYESGFEVERSTAGGPFAGLGEVDADVQSFTDEDAQGETEHVYRIRAVNAFGESDYATADAMSTPPWRPSDVTALTVSDTEVDVTWSDDSEAEARYRVEFRSLNDPSYSRASVVGADVTMLAHALLEPETTYLYRVRSENDDGASPWVVSNEVVTAPGAPQPRKPRSTSDTSVTISWADVSETETGFEVQRGLGCPGTGFVTVALLPEGSESYEDTGLEPETTYSYRIRAVRDEAASGWGEHICITTPPYAPESVAGAAISPSRVLVTWVDRSSAEEEFEIRRKELPDGIFKTIATLGTDVTEYLDSMAGPDTTYAYGVRSRNENGDSAEVLSAEVQTPSILVLSKAKVKRGKVTKKGTKPSKLQLTGAFDIGERGFHLGGAMTLRIGDTDIEVRSLSNKGKGYRYDGQGLRVDLRPMKGSVGRVAMKVTLQGAAADGLDPDGELLVGYEREDFRAVGAARLAEDRFEPRKGQGHQVEPRLGITKLSAKLKSGPKDSLKITGTFDPSGGVPDLEELPDGTIEFGRLQFRAPGNQFVEKKGKLSFKQNVLGARRKITLDYGKGAFTISLKGVELGKFTEGEHAVPVEIDIDGLRFRSTLQMTSTGKALRY